MLVMELMDKGSLEHVLKNNEGKMYIKWEIFPIRYC